MKLLAAILLSFSIVAGAASGQQTNIEGVKTMPTTEDICAVAHFDAEPRLTFRMSMDLSSTLVAEITHE